MKKNFVKLITLLLAMAMLLSLAACGSGKGSEKKAEGEYTVAYMAAATSLTTYTTLLEGYIKQACADRGWKYILMDAEGDSSKQAEQIESVKLMDVDCVVLYATDNEAAVTWCEDLNGQGIDIVLFASSINEGGYQYCKANVTVDSTKMGEDIANYLTGILPTGEKQNIAIIDNVPGQYDFVLRMNAFNKVLAEKTQWVTVGGDYCFADPATAQTNMENYLTAYDVNAVFGTTDANTVGACVALEDAGVAGKIPVVSIDGCKAAFDYIKSGTMTMTLFYDISGMADLLMGVLDKVQKGEAVEFNNWVPYVLVDASNVDEYYGEAEW